MSNNDGVGPGGKGDKPRPIEDRKKFEENFERIFGKKKWHYVNSINSCVMSSTMVNRWNTSLPIQVVIGK